ncbi:MAG: CPBP family intramembrane metalloprotease [Phycisphaerales bacterium]|nr:CPBP family intramembrane metalloprotease [Phycisphaerales bacterium]
MKAYTLWMALGSIPAAAIAALWWSRDAKRRAHATTREVAAVEPAVWALAALLLFIAPMVAGSLAAQMPTSVIGAPESVRRVAITQVAGFGFSLALGIVAAVLVARGARLRPDRTKPKLGLTARSMDLAWGAAGLLAVAPFYLIVSAGATWIDGLIRGEQPDPVKHTTLKMLNEALAAPGSPDRAWAWVVIASVVTLVPAVEELLYRGFVQSFVVRTMTPDGPRWRAVAMTSLLFAVMHVATGVVPWSAAAPLFVLSMGLGLAFERTGRIGVPIVMHGLFNAANVAVVVIARP